MSTKKTTKTEVRKLLENCKFSNYAVEIIALLLDGTEKQFSEIERLTGLRQPDISITLSFLSKMGYVQIREIERTGQNLKGRKRKCARLSKEEMGTLFDDAINNCEAEIKRYQKVQSDLIAVKNRLLSTQKKEESV